MNSDDLVYLILILLFFWLLQTVSPVNLESANYGSLWREALPPHRPLNADY